MRGVPPHAVKAMLADGEELALIDVREELIFSQNHLLWARSVPLSRLELRFARLVPRLGTRIVLCDDGDGLVERAAKVLTAGGYSNLSYLEGGVAGWAKAGFELFSGVHVPSKAFGEFIEHTCETPNISAEELHRLISDGADIVVLDSRPFDEYRRVSIPTSTNVPGAELVLRVRDMAPSPDTTVVVNCAGRTRSIIGAQSLINAGVPNKVVALRNGTMGWSLAGFTCDSGKDKRAPTASWTQPRMGKARRRRVLRNVTASSASASKRSTAGAADETRTIYLFDVRDPPEYAAGHVAGAISAPGGQLVQATDQYAGTLGARIVLVDDAEVRAVMTASWLKQMGWKDVFVLVAKRVPRQATPTALGSRDATPPPDCGESIAATVRAPAPATSNRDRSRRSARTIARRTFPAPGLPSARDLRRRCRKFPLQGELVLTSEDGVLAGFAVAEAAAPLPDDPVRYLVGGNAAWQAADLPFSTEPRMADEPVDVWLKPYERAGDTKVGDGRISHMGSRSAPAHRA